MEARLIFYIFAVCGAGLFTGVMLTIGLTLGFYWKSLPPLEFLNWFKENSHLIARTIPVVVLPTLIGLVGSIWLSWDSQAVRYLWVASFLCIIGVLLITVSYHLPTNAGFIAGTIKTEDVPSLLNMWLLLHSLRIVLGLFATVLGVIAVYRG